MSEVTKSIKLGLGPIKRKRDPVFTNNEKRILIDLVGEHFSVIECKKTDGVTSRAKYAKWAEITYSFNAQSDYIERDVQGLRNLWDNLKKKAKATMTILNGNRYATGGGPGKEPKEDPNVDSVISLIKTNVEGFTNIYDSDSVPTKTLSHAETDENLNFEVEICQDEHDYAKDLESETINGDWSHYTPAMLRTKRPTVLIEGRPPFTVAEDNFVAAEVVEFPFEEMNKTPPPVTPKTSMEGQKPKIEVVKTPQNLSTKSSRHMTNRRRPILKESEAVALATTKINTLKSTTEQAKQQHEVVMRCLYLQEEQEKEKLKQEQEKTEQEILKKKILLAELHKINSK